MPVFMETRLTEIQRLCACGPSHTASVFEEPGLLLIHPALHRRPPLLQWRVVLGQSS